MFKNKLIITYNYSRNSSESISIILSYFQEFFKIICSILKKMFIFFKKLHIILNLKKSYLEFLTINLLDQKVSSLELIIIQNKIEIIAKLKFLKNFCDLEIYLKLIS